MTGWRQLRAEAAQRWAEIERSGYLSTVVQDAVARHAAGERRAAKHVALDVLEDVWFSTRSRPLANLAYSRTLRSCRQAIHDAAATPPRRSTTRGLNERSPGPRWPKQGTREPDTGPRPDIPLTAL